MKKGSTKHADGLLLPCPTLAMKGRVVVVDQTIQNVPSPPVAWSLAGEVQPCLLPPRSRLSRLDV